MALSQGRKARLEKVFWAAHMGTTYPRNETNSRPKSKGPYCTRAVCRGRPAPARNIPPGPKAKRPWQLLRTPRGERQPGPAYCGHRLLARSPNWYRPKSVCPMLGKAKTQNIRVWIKERFTDRKGTNGDGRPNLQIRFKKMQSSGFFYVGEGGEGKGCFL